MRIVPFGGFFRSVHHDQIDQQQHHCQRCMLPSFAWSESVLDFDIDADGVFTYASLLLFLRERLLNHCRLVVRLWVDMVGGGGGDESAGRYVTLVFGSVLDNERGFFDGTEQLCACGFESGGGQQQQGQPQQGQTTNVAYATAITTTTYTGWCSHNNSYYQPVGLEEMVLHISKLLLLVRLSERYQCGELCLFGWYAPSTAVSRRFVPLIMSLALPVAESVVWDDERQCALLKVKGGGDVVHDWTGMDETLVLTWQQHIESVSRLIKKGASGGRRRRR